MSRSTGELIALCRRVGQYEIADRLTDLSVNWLRLRDVVQQALAQGFDHHGSSDKTSWSERARMAISGDSGWIAVTDRVPDNDRDVIGCLDHVYQKVCRYSPECRSWIGPDPTHWRELLPWPEPVVQVEPKKLAIDLAAAEKAMRDVTPAQKDWISGGYRE